MAAGNFPIKNGFFESGKRGNREALQRGAAQIAQTIDE